MGCATSTELLQFGEFRLDGFDAGLAGIELQRLKSGERRWTFHHRERVDLNITG